MAHWLQSGQAQKTQNPTELIFGHLLRMSERDQQLEVNM